MKMLILKRAILILVFTLVSGMVGTEPATAKEKVYKVQVPSQLPVSHPLTKAVQLFCDTVNENGQGRFELTHFPAGQLLTDKEIPKGISKGTVKIALVFLPWYSGMIPDIFPHAGKVTLTLDHALRLWRGPLLNHFDQRMNEKGNARIIAPLLYSFKNGYITKEPVMKLGDMKGMKIRIPTKVMAVEVEALGGVPTVMSSADVYMSLQRNTIQGATSGLPSIYVRKWYEAADNIISVKPAPADFHIIANMQWFDELPADLQRVLMEAGKTASEECTQMIVEIEDKVEDALKAKGVHIYKVSIEEYNEVYNPILEPALNAAAEKMFGQELTDAYNAWVESTR